VVEVSRKNKRWTEEERAYLRDSYGKKTAREIGECLGRSTEATNAQARFLGIIKSPHKVKTMMLCEDCGNAVPNTFTGKGCSWSRNLEPVEGWTAKPTKLRAHNRQDPEIGSYQVLACPEFVRDEPRKRGRIRR
jgi:hypothetical protein